MNSLLLAHSLRENRIALTAVFLCPLGYNSIMSLQSKNKPTDLFLFSIAEDPLPKRFFKWLERIFSINEYSETPRLVLVAYASLLAFFITFFDWFYSKSISMSTAARGTEMCWPYAQWCGKLYFLEALPLGYSQSIFYTGIFLLLIATTYAFAKREYILGHLGLLTLWTWKALVVFLFTMSSANYDYYDVIIGLALVFFPKKLPSMQWLFAFFYVLCATIKFSDGWILGRYFSSMEHGLPIFEHFATPLWSNLVILDQLILSWFLLSNNSKWRRTAFITFFLFHIYSTALVGFRYPTTSLVLLIVLFEGFNVEAFNNFIRAKWTSLLPIGVLTSLLLSLQVFAAYSYGFERGQDLETNYFGFYMFEANHQCTSTRTIHYKNNKVETRSSESTSAHARCSPYKYWFRVKNECTHNADIERIEWKFLHSTNGNPYVLDVDVPNACSLSFETLSHNDWITATNTTDILPHKNFYGPLTGLSTLPIEQVSNPRLPLYIRFYWILWSLALCTGLYVFIKKRTQK